MSKSFITEVKQSDPPGKKTKKSALSISVRKDYAKVQEVVQHFAKKVDVLIDKQRQEYLQAYEHHMSDVQRELYNLREKATAIANDTTREEKIKKLDSDQKWFRTEAMRLDVETNEYRKKMRDIKALIQATERERDWLLEKLRAAKDKYKKFKKERGELFEQFAFDGSIGSNSDSSYTLELQYNQATLPTGGPNWRTQLQKEFKISRDDPLAPSMPAMQTKPTANTRLSPLPHLSTRQRAQTEKRELLSKIVTLRAKQDGLKDFLGQCANLATVGHWSKLQRRPFEDILNDSIGILDDASPDSEEKRHVLARELVHYPDVYHIISDIVNAKSSAGLSQKHLTALGYDSVLHSYDNHDKAEEVEIDTPTQDNGEIDTPEGVLPIANDVMSYFEDQRRQRQEMELEAKERCVFGS